MTYLISIHFNDLEFETISPNIFIRKVSADVNEEKEKMVKSMITWSVNDPGNFYYPIRLSVKGFNDVYLIEDFGWSIEIFDTLEINAKFRVSEYNMRLRKMIKRIVDRLEVVKSKLSDGDETIERIIKNLSKTVSEISYHVYNNNSDYYDWYIYENDGKNFVCKEKYPKCKKDKIIL